MKRTIIILMGLTLAGSALTITAQPRQSCGFGGPHRYGAQWFPPPIAAIFDTNSDGALSEAEIAQAAGQLLKLDQNHDGQVSAAELCPGGLGRGAQGCPWGRQGRGRGACANGQKPVLLRLLDTDKDGALSGAEIGAAPSVLKALDKNGDGQVSPEEIRPLPGCGRACPWAQDQAK